MTLRPLNDRVIVKPDPKIEQIGSLHIVEHAKPDQCGVIVAVGPRCRNVVAPGDRVLFSWMAGQEIFNDETHERLIIMREDELLSVVPDQMEVTP